jgi:organic radical activating enzyme
MHKLPIPSSTPVAFYITNVCNLTCSECGSFNNYKIKGHYNWSDSADAIKRYSEEIVLNTIDILGGEPLLHPGLKDWCRGIRELWPDANIRLLTNGTRIATTSGLYQILQEYNIILAVSLHHNTESILNNVTEFLHGPVTTELRGMAGDDSFKVFRLLTDQNNVQVMLAKHHKFIKYSNFVNNQFYNSDPVKAHSVCKAADCFEIRDGKYYKCNLIPALLEINQQLDLNLDPDAIDLIKQYEPMQADWSYERKKEFIANLNQPMPQCRICPERRIWTAYTSQSKNDI